MNLDGCQILLSKEIWIHWYFSMLCIYFGICGMFKSLFSKWQSEACAFCAFHMEKTHWVIVFCTKYYVFCSTSTALTEQLYFSEFSEVAVKVVNQQNLISLLMSCINPEKYDHLICTAAGRLTISFFNLLVTLVKNSNTLELKETG